MKYQRFFLIVTTGFDKIEKFIGLSFNKSCMVIDKISQALFRLNK